MKKLIKSNTTVKARETYKNKPNVMARINKSIDEHCSSKTCWSSHTRSQQSYEENTRIIKQSAGLYASLLKGQGNQGIFSLAKGTLWGNCEFLLFKGSEAMTRGNRGNRVHCLREVSGLNLYIESTYFLRLQNLAVFSVNVLQEFSTFQLLQVI